MSAAIPERRPATEEISGVIERLSAGRSPFRPIGEPPNDSAQGKDGCPALWVTEFISLAFVVLARDRMR